MCIRDRTNTVTAPRRGGDRWFGLASQGAGVAVVALVTLVGVFLVSQAIPALSKNEANFLTSREWSVGGDNPRFGIMELLWTTTTASIIAMAIAVPIGVCVALFITEYAPQWLRRPAATLVDLLAAVPSIVYVLWGLIIFRPVVRPLEDWLSTRLGWLPLFAPTGITGGTIMFIGVVLAIMILPIVTAAPDARRPLPAPRRRPRRCVLRTPTRPSRAGAGGGGAVSAPYPPSAAGGPASQVSRTSASDAPAVCCSDETR